MNRKQRRSLKKIAGKEAVSSIDLMLNTPDHCLDCNKLFDKKDKEMVQTWFVKVFKIMKRVELYCPECFKKRSEDGIREE